MKIIYSINTIYFSLIIGFFLFTPFNSYCKDKILIVTENWEPFINSNMEGQGLLPQMIHTIFNNTNFEIDIQFFPWARALNLARSGEADCLLGAFYSSEREQYLLYPHELLTQKTALFTLESNNINLSSINDITKYKVGRVRNAVTEETFDSIISNNVVDLVNLEQCIQMLLIKRIDLIAGPEVNIQYLLNQKFTTVKDKVIKITPEIGTQNIYCCISRKSKHANEILEVLNRKIPELKQSGEFQRLYNMYFP